MGRDFLSGSQEEGEDPAKPENLAEKPGKESAPPKKRKKNPKSRREMAHNRDYMRGYRARKMATDPNYRLAEQLRSRVSHNCYNRDYTFPPFLCRIFYFLVISI